MRLRNLVKRVESLEAFSARHDDQPRYVLVTVVNTRQRDDDPEDGPLPPRWPPIDPDVITAGALMVLRLAGESDAAFHARAATLARRTDPGMVPVLMPGWQAQQAST